MSSGPGQSGVVDGMLLPVLERRAEIEALIAAHQVVVLCGATGSGKTTQLPQMCLDMGLASRGLIGHTQPRRLAARAVAARIAEERGVALGGLVGVKVRFQDQTTRATKIKVMTDGVLLAELASDPDLKAYSTIIIDEAHERSLNIDFLLGYLRTLLPRRADLKLIVTSATINPTQFSEAFGGPRIAPVIEVSGRLYPVEVRYAPAAEDDSLIDPEHVCDGVESLLRGRGGVEGDVLVFLPGEAEIRLAEQALRRRGTAAEVLPLYARLSNQEQDRIFKPTPGVRRVILATNVAETSLTVPGIRSVVDAGLARLSRYDPSRKVQRLPIEPVSRASADQRAGRCGRVAAGVCVRLYSEASFRARAAFTDPEIKRTNLAGTMLRMLTLGLGRVESFPFIDPPDAASIADGYHTLFELGAIDHAGPEGRLTPTGEAMARMPLDPRIARMLLGAAREGAVREVLILAAALETQDPRVRPHAKADEADRAQSIFRHPTSDFLTLLNLWDQFQHQVENAGRGDAERWCREHFVAAPRMREWGELVRQLRGVVEELGLKLNESAATEDAIHRALLTGLISNVACREGEAGSFDYRGVGGNIVQIFPGSALFKKGPKWIMAAEVVQTTRLYARTLAKIDAAWIEELAGHMFKRQLSDHYLDAETGEPSAWERVTMSGIVVVPRRRAAIAHADPALARQIFIREGLVKGLYKSEAPFMLANRAAFALVDEAQGKLRRHGLSVAESDIAAWFDSTLPRHIADPATFEAWLKDADEDALVLPREMVVKPEGSAADATRFPPHLLLSADTEPAPLTYAFAPGKDEDGVTAHIRLADLLTLSAERAAWLVPGMLPDLVAAMIKQLPKAQRAALEAQAGSTQACAEAIAGAVDFGKGALSAALSEAADVLLGVIIAEGAWSLKGIPAHLRLRLRVVDDKGHEVAIDRDIPALQERLAARVSRVQSAIAKARFEKHGLTAWTFGTLPDRVERDADEGGGVAYPAVLDESQSVRLTLLAEPREAAARTALGIRRLFVLACQDDLAPLIPAIEGWDDMARAYSALGTPAQLADELMLLGVERVFLWNQPVIRDRDAFEARLDAHRGRLAPGLFEVGAAIARTLEARAKVAHRLSGGTPRLWAASIADIREHAAYLMPKGFLSLLGWERVRHYPRFAEAMRARLFALREEGSRAETDTLAALAPRWKRFTAWVALQQAAAAQAESAQSPPATSGTQQAESKSAKSKAPLPQARRAAPTVNLDAGAWALTPGVLPPAIEDYRWALEELRVALFSGSAKPAPTDLDAMWPKAK